VVVTAQLDEGPERGVVEIVDVTVYLAPTHVIAKVLKIGVADGSSIKAGQWCRQWGVWEEVWPLMDVVGCEGRHNGRH